MSCLPAVLPTPRWPKRPRRAPRRAPKKAVVRKPPYRHDDDSVASDHDLHVLSGSYSKRGAAQLVNEDACAVVETEGVVLAGVLDGHGGGACAHFLADAIASHDADVMSWAEEVTASATTHVDDDARVAATTRRAFRALDARFAREASADPTSRGGDGDDDADAGIDRTGSGACGAFVAVSRDDADSLVVAHVGDCAVAARTDLSATRVLTTPHTLAVAAERAYVESHGGFVQDERVNGALVPTRAFGDASFKPAVRCEPEVARPRLRFERRALVVLYSDGVGDALGAEAALDVVERALEERPGDCRRAAKAVVRRCRELTADDVTCVVLQLTR